MRSPRFRVAPTSTGRLTIWIGLILALVSACAPQVDPPPSPAATQWLRVQVSPSLSNYSDVYSSCVPAGVGLALQQAAGTSFQPEQADLTLIWGEPQANLAYAVRLAQDDLSLVVNPLNPIASISLQALQTTYLGHLPAWDWDYLGQLPSPLNAYAYPDSSDILHIFAGGVFQPGQALDREVNLVPGPLEMRQAIARDPGGLGFLPSRWLDSSVKPIPIEGAPTQWTQPILALSGSEPQGAARDWLLCVQESLP